MRWLVGVLVFVSTGFSAGFTAGSAADETENVVFKSTPLAPGIYLLEGAGGNITALIRPNETFLVDDDFASMTPKLILKLKELGGDSPKFVVNTHFHYDHTGGNENFGSSALIIAATAVRDRLQSEQVLWREKHPAQSPQAWPRLTFDGSITLHVSEENVEILHLARGHTDGDTVVIFHKSKVASLGDLYFSRMYPIFHPEHEGSLDGLVANIASVLSRIPTDVKIVPGHGPVTSRAELENYHRMLKASIATVRRGMGKGMSLAEIQKRGLAAEWKSYGDGYLTTDKWLALVHRHLTK